MNESRRQQYVRLPAEVTSFVGRRHEVAEVKRLLSTSRTVTLTGVGGVGKTRLALRVGLDVARDFRGGVWFVELGSLENPDLLAQVVVEALEIRRQSADPPLRILADHLRDKHALIILDNCEHLVRACAVLAEELLRAAPRLHILATSREAMGFAGERIMPVPTLSVPDTDGSELSIESLARSDAVRLFTERAMAVLPSFALTEDNRDVVLQICHRLDGLPLGIELAAVRLRALSVRQLLDRLDDRFRLLTAGSPAEAPRHQTLRALIDWSYALCSEKERLLWARASVFAGGLDLEGAEAVCSGAGIDREEVLDLVCGLVAKSILIREENGSRVRYRLLEIIRQYGLERLAAQGEDAELQRRHRAYYRELAAQARAELFGPSQVSWFTRLRHEHANLHAALQGCLDNAEEAGACLEMAADLLYHWITGYYLGEGRRWLDRALAAGAGSPETRARALWAGSWLAIIQADVPAAAALLKESQTLGERLELEGVLAYVSLYSGMVAMYEGDTDTAIELYEQALARHRATGDPVGTTLALIRLSLAHSFRGDSARAIAMGDECLALADAHGEGWHKAYMMMALGVDVWRQGDPRRAFELETQSLTFNRAVGDPLGAGMNLEVLAWIAATEQHHERAARLLGALRAVWEAIGAPLSGYGHLARYHDDCERLAREALGRSAFEAAFEEGARLSYDDALDYALQRDERVGEPTGGGGERPASKGGSAPLTRREMEIARLVTRGLTNKEIASALVISQRTAESHIEHIMSKLGFRSRAQVAVWMNEHDGGSG
ncbi:LuxR C-terminal-related transcriptional regulator [Nonomuraea sp. 3-1Str]|uniref:LuxR C-terminal-related transcriptional regulator n=1 Tax=Nonomuraea sp. 3-1Str TaxID=2929801 RepID=UPI002856C89D|nr:LuxR C-terminal-related transcriptional regulator [Nonomuraea sp. 3-1Str]MDR8408438.1 LuxR C-terminal-related transcriptional regulator [Nonomuraea sp. 3-1Str]